MLGPGLASILLPAEHASLNLHKYLLKKEQSSGLTSVNFDILIYTVHHRIGYRFLFMRVALSLRMTSPGQTLSASSSTFRVKDIGKLPSIDIQKEVLEYDTSIEQTYVLVQAALEPRKVGSLPPWTARETSLR